MSSFEVALFVFFNSFFATTMIYTYKKLVCIHECNKELLEIIARNNDFNDSDPPTEDFIDESHLERERAFNERIEKIKDELAKQNLTQNTQVHTVADELHPMVKNLPHDDVMASYENPPDLEIAE